MLKRKNPTTLQGTLTEIAFLGKAGADGKRSVSSVLRTVWKDSVSSSCPNFPMPQRTQHSKVLQTV